MIGRSYIPGELIAGAYSAAIAFLIALAVGIARLRERVGRLEEWQRVYERRINGIRHDDEDA